MIRKLILLLLVAFAGVSCTSNKVPSNVLSQDKMQAILWDMFRAGNHVTSHLLTKDSTLKSEPEQIKWFNRVLTIHKVSEKQFKSSMEYYKSRPELLARIMDSLSKKESAPVIKPKVTIEAVQ